MSRAAGAAAVALALVLALAGPAQAKGIQSATITGPGLDEPIDVGQGDGDRLASLTAFWAVMPVQPPPPALADEAPAEQLGPRYRLTWRLMTDADETTAIRQDLYPYAAGGPLVHTAAGQPIFGGATVGGWYEAPVALLERLDALGVPPASSRGVVAAPSSGDSPWPAVFTVAAAVAALAGVGGVVAVRRARRRERVATVPL